MLKLRFRRDATIEEQSADSFILNAPEVGRLTFRALTPGLVSVVRTLSNGGATEPDLEAAVAVHDGPARLIPYYQFMFGLSSRSLLTHTLLHDGQPVATIAPIARHYRFDARLAQPDQTYVLSRFAYLRQENGLFVLETPRGYARVTLHAEPAFTLLSTFAAPQCGRDLAAANPALGDDTVNGFINLLLNAGALVAWAPDAQPETGDDPALMMWDFHDLLFHARSRQGRHNNPYGGTFRYRGTVEPLPLIKAYPDAETIALPRPDIAALRAADVPFTDVVETRRSVRDYDEQALLTVEQLGHFLYRSARIQQVLPTGPDMPDFSFRPHPGGGAVHELNIYPVIGNCAGVPAGIYYYNPLDHALHKVAGDGELMRRLLYIAWITADRKSQPQVFFGITARFQRLQWKYESMAYAVTLKNVGALYQTMYLVATAMGLAPCALGGGNSDLFGLAAGLDYYAESLVGEFMLGSRGAAQPGTW